VLGIAKDSPIYFSDIREGDVITHINAAAAKDISDELVEDALFGNDFGMVNLNYAGYMTRQAGEAFIRRNASAAPSATLAASKPDAPVIVIHNFRAGSARALKALIDGLGASAAKGAIIDVRGNTGGELIEAIEAANLFVDGGDLLKTKGRGADTNQLFTAKAGDILSGKPIVIIADMTTRGAAEAFVLAMGARKRAVAAGSPTFGNGTAASRFELTGGRAASFATKAVFSADGQALDGIGALPLVCIASFKNEKDIDAFAKNATSGKFKDERPKLEKPSAADIEAARKACPAVYPTISAQSNAVKIAESILLKDGVYDALIKM
jgi:carboxyl-terminal processing protease